jgi:hypothetical protein
MPWLFVGIAKIKIKMKNITSIIVALLLGHTTLLAQVEKKENISFTSAEFKAGYGITIFGPGLKERVDAGNFSNSGGGLASLAAYRKFKKINNLNFGIKYKSLGAGPAKGDNGQEMFFNYWGAAFTAKYFPFDKNAKKGIYLQGDYFFVSQFTQKYRTTVNKNFEHQFAIGNGFVVGAGYDLPLGKTQTMLTIGVEYEMNSRNGEVTGIGSKTFKNSNFGVMTGVKF